MEKQHEQRIVIDQRVMAGKPIIKGTRIPVAQIIKLLAHGMTPKEILEDYPQLTKEDIKAALAYVSALINNEDIFQLK